MKRAPWANRPKNDNPRVKEIPNVGAHFYPDGIPIGSSNTEWKSVFRDSKGLWYICYTRAQIDAQLKANGVFCPYFPLMTTPGL